MMQLDHLLASMTPQVYEKLLQAVATGKWQDGTALTEQQQQSTMQAVLLYQSKILKSEQHMTVGEDGKINHKSHQQLQQEFSPQHTIVRFTQDDI